MTKPDPSAAIVPASTDALAPAPLAGETVELETTFDDTSLEMNAAGDKFRVSYALQSQIAASAPNPQWWDPPAVPHAQDVEFNDSNLKGWQWWRMDTMAPITPVPGVAPSTLSAPAPETFRVSFGLKRGHVSVQPAKDFFIGLVRSIPANTRPPNVQFSMRGVFPAVRDINSAGAGASMAFEIVCDYFDAPHRSTGQHLLISQTAKDNVKIEAAYRSGWNQLDTIQSPSLDFQPFDFEFIYQFRPTADVSSYMRSGGALHRLCSSGIGTIDKPRWIAVIFKSTGVWSPIVPNVPAIYHVDYLRQLDSAEVF